MPRGFTLVEISMVLGIILLLLCGGVGLWSLGWSGAQRAETKSQLAALAAHLYAVRATTGSFPEALPATLTTTDPWGHAYNYAFNSTALTLSSKGPDADAAADDIFWK